MSLSTVATLAGYKSHYTADGKRTLCGREVSNSTSGIDMCKACDKAAAKLTPAAPVEPTPAPVSKLDKITELTGVTLPDAPECTAHKRAGWDESGHACIVLPNGVHTYLGMLRYSDGKGRHGVAVIFPHAWESRRDETGVITYYADGGVMTLDMLARAYAGETVDGTPAPVDDAPADAFDMANLTPAQITVLETNIGRVPEVIKAAADVARAALGAIDGASSHHAWQHQLTYYREATAILGAGIDPAAYSSAVVNANDTARENGFPYMSAEWFACFDSSYEFMRVENATERDRAAFYAEQDAETEREALEAALSRAERHMEGDATLYRAHAPARAHADSMGATVLSNYPRVDANGHTVWACCESAMGAPCQHRTGRTPGEPALIVEPCRSDRSKVTVWLMGAGDTQTMTIRRGRDESLRAALWARGHGFRPETRRGKVAWQRHETLSLVPLASI